MSGRRGTVLVLALLLVGCPDDEPTTGADAMQLDTADEADIEADAAADTTASAEDATEDSVSQSDGLVEEPTDDASEDLPDDTVDASVDMAPAPLNLAAAALGFQLYYRERVDRMMVPYNRFALFGGSTYGSNIRGIALSRTGDDFEVVPGPTDNNLIGTPIWATWQAYRLYRTRPLALTLIRMFDGLVYYEQVTGHPGLTSREVYPGWTRVMDGIEGEVALTRLGEPVESPIAVDAALEAEVLETFYDGVRVIYRENPAEFFFSFMPVARVGDYSVTLSFSELPQYLRSSHCCSSLMRTPDELPWAGAFWGNHNSRDNFPDLALGLLAALAAATAEDIDPDVKAAALRALEAGHRIGDLMQAHDGTLMTVDEHNPYDTLVVGGAVRPHGEPENQTLGEMGACSMAYLSVAISSAGLDLPLPEVPLPESPESLLGDQFGGVLDCEIPEGVRMCATLQEAFCGHDWGNIDELSVGNRALLDFVRTLEEMTPGTAEQWLGGFQNDFDDVAEAMVALVHYAEIMGRPDLAVEARSALKDLTDVMRTFADLIYETIDPARQARQRYEAALFDGAGGVDVIEEDLMGLETEARRLEHIESFARFAETTPPSLVDDETLQARAEAELHPWETREWGRVTVFDRYRDEYGMSPPVRRTEEGYEARGTPLEDYPWGPVENPSHVRTGNLDLMQGITLCHSARHIVDCTWAALGCERPDLNADGVVDSTDNDLMVAAVGSFTGVSCAEGNDWCEGADLDQSGDLEAADYAFMEAAQGCTW